MRKYILLFLLFLLAACSNQKDLTTQTIKYSILPSISVSAITGVYVAVSDPHSYSKTWPETISWSFYFNPQVFYSPVNNLSIFTNAYYSLWNTKKVYYYDENWGSQAWLLVYVLRNYFHKDNVSLLLSDQIQDLIKYKQLTHKIPKDLSSLNIELTWWYIWTGKYRIVYDPSKISFKTGDLLLYSSDLGTMKEDGFYQENKWKINMESFDWSKLLDIKKWLAPSKKDLSKLSNLSNYKVVYIYYPRYRYRSWVLALYLQENK